MNNYLVALSKFIRKELPEEEYNDVMQYYTEYFADAGADKEWEVINELGTPENLAKKIISEYRGKQEEVIPAKQKKGLAVGWIILIAIVGSPLWLTLLCIGIAVLTVIIAVIAVFGAMGIVGIIGGVALIVGGIAMLFIDPALGILLMGYGFIFGAAGCGMIMLTVLLVQLITKIIKKIKGKKNKAVNKGGIPNEEIL